MRSEYHAAARMVIAPMRARALSLDVLEHGRPCFGAALLGVGLDPTAQPTDEAVLVIADARLRHDANFGRSADPADRKSMNSGVFAGHRQRANHQRIRLDRHL